MLINAWRAIKHAPEELAKICSDPNSHVLYWQRICYLVKEKENLLDRILQDDEYFDVKLAGYWLYYKGCEIGTIDLDSLDVEKVYASTTNGITVGRNQLVSSNGIHSAYNKILDKEERLITWFNDLKAILENTKICCLDWKRLFNEGVQWQDYGGTRKAAIFFDPPYSNARRGGLYRKDSYEVYKEVNEFCIKNADRKTYKIVVAGYEGEHNNLEDYGYTKYEWHAHGGYSNLGNVVSDNRLKERLWASKSCNNVDMQNMTINQYMKEAS